MDLLLLGPDRKLANLENTIRGRECGASHQERRVQRTGISRCQVSLYLGGGGDYLENAGLGRGDRPRPPKRGGVCLVEDRPWRHLRGWRVNHRRPGETL